PGGMVRRSHSAGCPNRSTPDIPCGVGRSARSLRKPDKEDRPLGVADDLPENLAAALLAAPGPGVLVAVENDPSSVGAHPRNREIGERDDRRVTCPLDGHRQREREVAPAVLEARTKEPGLAGELRNTFDDVLLLTDNFVVVQA